MSFNVTTSRDIVKPLQFVEEGTTSATYGVTPTSPTFIAAGINTEIRTNPNIVSEQIRALGLEDYTDSVKTQENYAFSIRSNILNTTLAKYGINAVSGAGTIGASLTFEYSKNIDGTEYFTKIVGARPTSTTLSVNRGLWSLDMTFHAKEIKDETTSATAGATYVTSIPAGSPLKHQDGANPFSWNSVVFPERSFSMTVTRDLALQESNGDVLVLFSKAAVRNISWSAEVYKKSTAILTDKYDAAERTLTYKIGGSDVATFTDALITDYEESHLGGDSSATIERISGISRTVNIA